METNQKPYFQDIFERKSQKIISNEFLNEPVTHWFFCWEETWNSKRSSVYTAGKRSCSLGYLFWHRYTFGEMLRFVWLCLGVLLKMGIHRGLFRVPLACFPHKYWNYSVHLHNGWLLRSQINLILPRSPNLPIPSHSSTQVSGRNSGEVLGNIGEVCATAKYDLFLCEMQRHSQILYNLILWGLSPLRIEGNAWRGRVAVGSDVWCKAVDALQCSGEGTNQKLASRV